MKIDERIAYSTNLQNPENSYLSEIDDFPPSGNHNLSPVPLFNRRAPHQQNHLVKNAFLANLEAKEKRKVYLVL
jgi:hypothetical protein